jgi:anti-sigma B factor antagonist
MVLPIASERVDFYIGLLYDLTIHTKKERNGMKLKEKMDGDIAILTLKGDLIGEPDTTNIRDKIHSLVSDEVKKVIIDMGDVNFVNSSGLGTLISALTTLKNADGDLRLAQVGKRTQNLLTITHLVKVFDIYETVDRAVASFRTGKK